MDDERCEGCGRRMRDSLSDLCGPCQKAEDERLRIESQAGWDDVMEFGDPSDWDNFA